MLNLTDLTKYCFDLDLSEAAIAQIKAIRSSEPVRHVQGRGSNVCARYPSRKMRRVIQAESRTVELMAIRCAYEFEPQVLEYWDQPCQIELKYQAGNGRPVRVPHTPDFFVLRQDRAGWEEWKPSEQLEKLAKKMPHRYQQLGDGRWHCPPGEAYAAQYGLYYQIRLSSEFSPTYQRNVAILEDYLVDDGPEVDKTIQPRIVAAVREQPGITLMELQGHFCTDELLRAIARDVLYTDLEAAALVNPDQVRLFTSVEVAQVRPQLSPRNQSMALVQVGGLEVGVAIWWDERVWRIVNMGLERIALLPDVVNGRLVELSYTDLEQLMATGRVTLPMTPEASAPDPVLERIRQASPKALEQATKRVRAVEALLSGQQPETLYAERTLRGYKRRYLEAKARLGSGFVGLLDNNHKKGNRQPRLSAESQAQLEKFIIQSYETFKQKSVLRVYSEYVLACEEQNLQPACYTTFSWWVKRRPQPEQVRNRQGKRAAYQTGPQIWRLSYDTPRHGDFPWQYGHIDHTQLNIEMVCAKTGQVLGRPWLSLLLDAFSRRILAVYITFDPPSYRSCMAILVECVSRHQRLPLQIIVDNGPDFRSTYFETMLAYYKVTKLSRPTAQPRTGSLIERLFRTSDTEFVHNLRGNTQIMKLVRQVTKEVNPKNQAIWTLDLFYDYFCQWSYEVYDQLVHTTLGQSPREAYLAGLTATGVRPNRQVVFDESFRILTLPTTKRGKAKVIAGSGVKVNYLYYWCDAFRQPDVERSAVPVRYDPFNAGIAYAYVNGLWERCISERYAIFQGRTEREMGIATTALRQQKRLGRQQVDINAKTLTAFLTSVEGQEALLEQQLKDKAAQHIHSSIFELSPLETGPQTVEEAIVATPSRSARRKIDLNELENYGDLIL